MAFTNDPLNSLVDRTRLMVGDIDEYEEGISDEIYQYIIDKHTTDGATDEIQAALEALRALVAKYANYVTEKAGGLFSKESEKYEQYKDLLNEWTKNPSSGFMKVGAGFAGGIYVDDMQQNAAVSNNNLDPFYIGQKSRIDNSVYYPESFRAEYWYGPDR